MVPIDSLYELFNQATGISTDTRSINKGDLFFALKGPHFDGNKYATEAIEKGAIYAIVDDHSIRKKSTKLIWVPNVLSCLHRLANYHRRHLDIPILAITGTNGKTTTKELVDHVLSHKFKVHSTQGNLNNHIGVPITLLSISKDSEVAVIEMGANHIGEIKMLCQLVNPSHGLVTNVGKGHLEGFGSLQGVYQAKFELYDYLEYHDGKCFMNLEEPCFKEIDVKKYKRLITFSRSRLFESLTSIEVLSNNPFIKLRLKFDQIEYQVRSSLFGEHNVRNIISAIAMGIAFKVPLSKVARGIQQYTPQNNRSQIIETDAHTYYLDAYNANPSSVGQAIDFFSKLDVQPKIMVIGDMLELGDESLQEHRLVFSRLRKDQSIDKVLFVGPIFGQVLEGLNLQNYLHFEDVYQARHYLVQYKIMKSYIYIKGSRKIGLEKLLF